MATIEALIADAPVWRYGNSDLDDIPCDAAMFGLINGFVRECAHILPVLIWGFPWYGPVNLGGYLGILFSGIDQEPSLVGGPGILVSHSGLRDSRKM
jgi:hypothetical protein